MVCHSYIDMSSDVSMCMGSGSVRGLTTARTTADHPAQCRDCLSYCFVVVEGIRPPPLPSSILILVLLSQGDQIHVLWGEIGQFQGDIVGDQHAAGWKGALGQQQWRTLSPEEHASL